MPFFTKYKIEDIAGQISREDILQRSRILIVDDERPDLIEDLMQGGFAVDYLPDITNANMNVIDRPKYDLIILDFGSVGTAFGHDQGLSLLKFIKRVNPTAHVLAYTSKALGTEHAEFFRLADGVLPKDAGIAESMEKIESALAEARSVKNLWKGMLSATGVKPGSKEDDEWQHLFVAGLQKPGKMRALKDKVVKTVGSENGQKVSLFILEKLAELATKSITG